MKTRATTAATKTCAAVSASRKEEAPPVRKEEAPPPPPAEDTVGGTSVVINEAGEPIVRILPAESQGEEIQLVRPGTGRGGEEEKELRAS